MKNILIVVDLQNGFTRYDQTIKLAKNVIHLTNQNYFDYVIATRFINIEGSQYTRMLNWHRLIKSPDIDLVEGLNPDKVIDKNIYTCVNDKFLLLLKDINGGSLPSHVFIVGVDTDCCVLKIATDLFENNIMPLVLTNYCASNGGELSHQAGVLAMKRLVGVKSLIDQEISSKADLKEIIMARKF